MDMEYTYCNKCGNVSKIYSCDVQAVSDEHERLTEEGGWCKCNDQPTPNLDHERIRRELWKDVYVVESQRVLKDVQLLSTHRANAAVDAFDKKFGEATQC